MKKTAKIFSAILTLAVCLCVMCVTVSAASDKLFTENCSDHVIVRLTDGTYRELTEDEYTDFVYYSWYKKYATKEMYNEYLEYGYDFTYEEYLEYISGSLGVEVDTKAYDSYRTVYDIDGYSEDGTDYRKAAQAAFEYVKGKTSKAGRKNGMPAVIYVDYSVRGDFIRVRAAYDDYVDPNHSGTIVDTTYIGMDGKEVWTLNGNPISSDTKSLYINSSDETVGSILDDGAAEGYDTVIYDFDGTLDIAVLQKNFPGLKKLYISYGVTLKSPAALAKFTSLEELCIDVSDYNDLSFLSKVKTTKLVISGIDGPAGVLAEMDVKEICVTCKASEYMSDIYKLKNVTELTIERYSKTKLSLSGIEKMTGLRKLDISADSDYALDVAPVAKLTNLNELFIMAHETKNLSKISGLTKLKTLTLHSMEEEDLSFLSKMTGLRELYLMYVNSSFVSSLPKLTKVKNLGIVDITEYVDYSKVYKMKSLEELLIMGGKGVVSVKGIEKLEKLESLSLMLCSYGDLSPLGKCKNLKNLLIYNCLTPEFDANDIKGLKSLESLRFNCSEIKNYKSLKTLTGLKEMNLYFCNLTGEEIAELKKALPKCEIRLDTD